MNNAKEDLLLHPIRVRIMQAVGLRQVTAQQLAKELPDIPQATLYRHINTLAEAGILVVVKERRVHNTLEKTYSLAHDGLFLTPEDMQNGQPEDYIRVFTRYLGQLLGYFTRYIEHGNVDVVRDFVGFQMLPFNLSETEVKQLAQALSEVVLPYLKNEPSPERRRYILGLMTIPAAGGSAVPGDTSKDAAPAKSSGLPENGDGQLKGNDHERDR
jgi:DNA-binding transcriptional ArsR family regulator